MRGQLAIQGGQPKVRRTYRRDNPNRRIRACAAPSGTGMNGPGGALVISATKPSATIASQNVSQKPSIYASTFASRCTSAESDPMARDVAVAASWLVKLP